MTRKEKIALNKIREYQEDLKASLKEENITQPADLSRIKVMVRRGMIQTVSDIFELSNQLSDEINTKIPWKRDLVKQFRNTATHRYGSVDNVFAYAYIMHCVDKEMMKSVRTLSLKAAGLE